METRVPRVLRVLFARLLACLINLRARVRVTCKHTCEDVNLLQVCTVWIKLLSIILCQNSALVFSVPKFFLVPQLFISIPTPFLNV